jgi:hypothetical protein
MSALAIQLGSESKKIACKKRYQVDLKGSRAVRSSTFIRLVDQSAIQAEMWHQVELSVMDFYE